MWSSASKILAEYHQFHVRKEGGSGPWLPVCVSHPQGPSNLHQYMIISNFQINVFIAAHSWEYVLILSTLPNTRDVWNFFSGMSLRISFLVLQKNYLCSFLGPAGVSLKPIYYSENGPLIISKLSNPPSEAAILAPWWTFKNHTLTAPEVTPERKPECSWPWQCLLARAGGPQTWAALTWTQHFWWPGQKASLYISVALHRVKGYTVVKRGETCTHLQTTVQLRELRPPTLITFPSC